MSTEVLKVSEIERYDEALDRAARIITDGGIVAFPTETVYGIGANAASPQAMQRLRELKQRAEDKPFTVHLGHREEMGRFVPSPSRTGRQLAAKAWPGPLTLIFSVPDYHNAPVARELGVERARAIYHEGTVGLRCPDSLVAQNLLTRVKAPVVAASANRASRPPALSAQDVLDELPAELDLVLDGGIARYATPSTVVRVDDESFEIVREGVFDQRTVQRLATFTILFVCTGNTCRSPMAAAWCRHLLARRFGCRPDEIGGRGYTVCSAGTFAMAGAPATRGACAALAAEGVEIGPHRSQPVTVELIHQADRIYTMCESHRETVIDLVPSAESRTERLDQEAEIEDPLGDDDEAYRQCAARIRRHVERRLTEVVS